jgi:hypothetical protein
MEQLVTLLTYAVNQGQFGIARPLIRSLSVIITGTGPRGPSGPVGPTGPAELTGPMGVDAGEEA